jgi:hypothetical protein
MWMLQLAWRTDPVHAHHGDRQPRPPHPRPRHRRLPHLLLQQRLRTGQPKNKLYYFLQTTISLSTYFSVSLTGTRGWSSHSFYLRSMQGDAAINYYPRSL